MPHSLDDDRRPSDDIGAPGRFTFARGLPTGFETLFEPSAEVLRPGKIEEELGAIDRDRGIFGSGTVGLGGIEGE
ncbi:MAG TPA: hypothetical protein VLJ88_16705, partial [Propionibacteriaceae bacterium]|nr:hypothetical protein [Propionibacteriaceae bacterium]